TPWMQYVRVLILTAQRRREVARARWREIDLDQRIWTIPAERAKSNFAHVVPLSDAVVALLGSLPRSALARNDFVFSTDNGVTPIGGFSKLKARLDAAILAARVEAAGETGMAAELVQAPPRWTLHDLRRTARTH